MKTRILITGGSGFIGSNFIKSTTSLFDFYKVGREIPTLDSIRTFNPDILIHLSANTSFNNETEIRNLIQSNIEFPSIITELFIQSGGKKILNIGSYWEHVNNLAYSPNSFYASTKKAFQDILQYYVDCKNIEVITLKLFDTYGPNDKRKKILRLVYEASQSTKKIDLSGGEQLYNLVHISDVIKGFKIALEQMDVGHQIYFLKSTQQLKLKKVIEIYKKINELDVDLIWGKYPYSKRDFFSDINVYPLLPNWKEEINLENGLKNLYQN